MGTWLSTGFESKHHQENCREVSQLTHTNTRIYPPLPYLSPALLSLSLSDFFLSEPCFVPLLGPALPKADNVHETFTESGFCDQKSGKAISEPVYSWATQMIQDHRNSSQQKASQLNITRHGAHGHTFVKLLPKHSPELALGHASAD